MVRTQDIFTILNIHIIIQVAIYTDTISLPLWEIKWIVIARIEMSRKMSKSGTRVQLKKIRFRQNQGGASYFTKYSQIH